VDSSTQAVAHCERQRPGVAGEDSLEAEGQRIAMMVSDVLLSLKSHRRTSVLRTDRDRATGTMECLESGNTAVQEFSDTECGTASPILFTGEAVNRFGSDLFSSATATQDNHPHTGKEMDGGTGGKEDQYREGYSDKTDRVVENRNTFDRHKHNMEWDCASLNNQTEDGANCSVLMNNMSTTVLYDRGVENKNTSDRQEHNMEWDSASMNIQTE
jgi:hypothetical protein